MFMSVFDQMSETTYPPTMPIGEQIEAERELLSWMKEGLSDPFQKHKLQHELNLQALGYALNNNAPLLRVCLDEGANRADVAAALLYACATEKNRTVSRQVQTLLGL